jgi:hypothetical protein
MAKRDKHGGSAWVLVTHQQVRTAFFDLEGHNAFPRGVLLTSSGVCLYSARMQLLQAMGERPGEL